MAFGADDSGERFSKCVGLRFFLPPFCSGTGCGFVGSAPPYGRRLRGRSRRSLKDTGAGPGEEGFPLEADTRCLSVRELARALQGIAHQGTAHAPAHLAIELEVRDRELPPDRISWMFPKRQSAGAVHDLADILWLYFSGNGLDCGGCS